MYKYRPKITLFLISVKKNNNIRILYITLSQKQNRKRGNKENEYLKLLELKRHKNQLEPKPLRLYK